VRNQIAILELFSVSPYLNLTLDSKNAKWGWYKIKDFTSEARKISAMGHARLFDWRTGKPKKRKLQEQGSPSISTK
jgi:hypothetical protein